MSKYDVGEVVYHKVDGRGIVVIAEYLYADKFDGRYVDREGIYRTDDFNDQEVVNTLGE